MSEIDRAKARLRELKESINPVIKKTFEEQKDLIISYNVDEQLYKKGEDSKGVSIRPAYKPITIKMKRAKGQPTDRVTTRDTKNFHNSLIIEAKDDVVEITTSVEYAKYLFKRYGSDILGIQEELLKEFTVKYILPNLKTEWNGQLAKS